MSTNKSFSTETSERYSRALFEVSRDSDDLDKVENDIKNFKLIYDKNLEVRNFIKDPSQIITEQNKLVNLVSDKLNFSKKKFTTDEVKEEFISFIQSFNEIGELNLNSSTILNLNLMRKISSIIKSLDIDNVEKDNLIFDFELELSKTDSNEINKKIQTIKRKISDLEVESNQFQNNLEFFSSSSSENPLFKNVSTKIESIEKKIEFWRAKLKKIEKV